MGLKCRLLGHTYGEPEVERDREEQGDEVVVTIREVQVCERCGDEQVVSQNKEVTAIRSPAEVGLGEEPTGGETAAEDAPADARGGADEGGESDQPTVSPAESTAASAEPTAAPASAEADGTDAAASADAPSDPSGATETAADAEAGVTPAADAAGETADGTGTDVIDEAEASGAGDGWETGSDDWEDVETDVDDAVILDDAETERDQTQWPEETDTDPQRAARESAAREEASGGVEPEPDGEVTNDAEIIDADEGESGGGAGPNAGAEAGTADRASGRERGEWAERDADAASNGWPDHDSEDEGYAATPGGDADVEFGSGGGLTPEVNGHADADAEAVEGIAAGADGPGARAEATDPTPDAEAVSEADEGFARAGESATLESDVPDDRVEFYCPNCGYARVAGASSMRAGDICPECKQGYIAERER